MKPATIRLDLESLRLLAAAGPQVPLVMLIYLDFGTHPPRVQRDLLASARARLRPGGRFVFDFP